MGEQEPLPVAPGGDATGIALEITATEDDLFVVNRALNKLRELLGPGGTMRLRLDVTAATGGEPIDRIKARNTVVEPLDEDDEVELIWRWTGAQE